MLVKQRQVFVTTNKHSQELPRSHAISSRAYCATGHVVVIGNERALHSTRADNGAAGATARYAFFRSEPQKCFIQFCCQCDNGSVSGKVY